MALSASSAWCKAKRIASERAQNVPLFLFTYRDTQKKMAQNANGIAINVVYR
jgi:hypothetical protein